MSNQEPQLTISATTNEAGLKRRRPSRRILRSIWFGLFLGTLPTTCPLFWLAWLVPAFISLRLPLVIFAVAIGWFVHPQLDSIVEPLGVSVLKWPEAKSTLTALAELQVLNILQWHNSVVAAYLVIFFAGGVALGTAKQTFRLGTILFAGRNQAAIVVSETVLVDDDSDRYEKLLQEVIQIADSVQTTAATSQPLDVEPAQIIPYDRTLVVHNSHSSTANDLAIVINKPQLSSDLAAKPYPQPASAPSSLDLHNQVWEIPTLVDCDEMTSQLEEILQSIPSLVGVTTESVGSETSKAENVSVLDSRKLSNKSTKRRKVTVKETIIDIVRWKKPSVQSASQTSINTAGVKSDSLAPSIAASTADAAATPPSLSETKGHEPDTLIVMAPEPLPFLMGYLSNLNRSSDKPGGR